MTLNHNYECSNEAVTGIAGNSDIGETLPSYNEHNINYI